MKKIFQPNRQRLFRSPRMHKRIVPCALAFAIAGLLAGCGSSNVDTAPATTALHLTGKVFGGQQPVSGATLQLYAAGTAGYASAATALLTKTVTSDSNGSFSITGDYTCPANAQVYLVATGGNPGLTPSTTTNANLAMMTGLGACSSLTASTPVTINELTTVASVWSLARFMSGYAALGSSATNTAGLASAFAVIPEVVNTGTGNTPGPALPANASLSTTELNTLADILAACVNTSGGAAGDTTNCGKLFTAATAGSSVPHDTIAAALNIALNPALNTSSLFALTSASSPFQPMLQSAPQNFLVAITYSGGGLNAPAAIAPDAAGNIWAANANSTLTELSNTGAAISPSGGFTGGGLNNPSALAIDTAGTVWVTNRTGNSISLFNASGAPLSRSPLTGGGLSGPSSIAINEDGSAWITNAGNSSVSAFSATFSALSSTGYTGAGISQPVAVAINPH
jgi:hypothetical protein